jgi:cysteinyl-tRNA synthetase
MENTEKQKTETTKIDGISAQINLSPGSETHRRFAQLMREAGATTSRSFVETLMDAYQNPHVDTDNSEVIANMEQQITDLKSENAAYDATCQNLELDIENLKMELATARNEANENAAKAMKIQTDTDGAIIVKPNPVSAYFLKEMAERENTTPEKILERLFIDDLQNPRANNLPYTVSSSRIREVMDELKQQQQ